MAEYVFIVEPPQVGERLDVFIARQAAGRFSRSAARRLIDDEAVTVDGAHARPNRRLHLGERVCVSDLHNPAAAVPLSPEKVPLDILYEDSEILVLNKPVGMLVHPAGGQTTGTLVNALLHHCASLSAVNDEDRPGIVHRLDRETSGVMVVAKTDLAHAHLARQFERRKVIKKYVAIVKGHIELDEGRIDAPIGRHPVYFDKKAVSYDTHTGRPASTFYRVVKRFRADATAVDLFPKTGRTHQLRVHMKHLGHPILGDDKYGSARSFPRLALHAQSIQFRHPAQYYFLEFSVPPPEEFFRSEEILAGIS